MSKEYSKRNSHALNLGRIISKVVKPVLKTRGFYDVDIISEWENIIGPEWAKQTCPHKLSFSAHSRRSGTLHLLVTPGASVLIQHIQPMIVDRINTYFGFDAVSRLKIIHGYVPVTRLPKSKSGTTEIAPIPDVQDISDPDLKDALERWGQGLAQEKLASGR